MSEISNMSEMLDMQSAKIVKKAALGHSALQNQEEEKVAKKFARPSPSPRGPEPSRVAEKQPGTQNNVARLVRRWSEDLPVRRSSTCVESSTILPSSVRPVVTARVAKLEADRAAKLKDVKEREEEIAELKHKYLGHEPEPEENIARYDEEDLAELNKVEADCERALAAEIAALKDEVATLRADPVVSAHAKERTSEAIEIEHIAKLQAYYETEKDAAAAKHKAEVAILKHYYSAASEREKAVTTAYTHLVKTIKANDIAAAARYEAKIADVENELAAVKAELEPRLLLEALFLKAPHKVAQDDLGGSDTKIEELGATPAAEANDDVPDIKDQE